jgi:hypothetical protein
MDIQARRRLMLELEAERDELNRRAGRLEHQAAGLDPNVDGQGETRKALVTDAAELRERAREVGRRWSDLSDDDLHDDDREG